MSTTLSVRLEEDLARKFVQSCYNCGKTPSEKLKELISNGNSDDVDGLKRELRKSKDENFSLSLENMTLKHKLNSTFKPIRRCSDRHNACNAKSAHSH